DRAAPAGVEPAGQEQLAAVGDHVNIRELADALQQLRVAHLEDAAHAPLVSTGPEHFGGAAQAEQHLDRADHQALARAGRAGETVQPRPQLDPNVGDHGEVGNVQFAEHG